MFLGWIGNRNCIWIANIVATKHTHSLWRHFIQSIDVRGASSERTSTISLSMPMAACMVFGVYVFYMNLKFCSHVLTLHCLQLFAPQLVPRPGKLLVEASPARQLHRLGQLGSVHHNENARSPRSCPEMYCKGNVGDFKAGCIKLGSHICWIKIWIEDGDHKCSPGCNKGSPSWNTVGRRSCWLDDQVEWHEGGPTVPQL